MKVPLTDDDRGALAAFGVSSLTTNSVYVEPRWSYLDVSPHRRIVTRRHARDGATAPYAVPTHTRQGVRAVQAPIGITAAYWATWADEMDALAMPDPNVVIGASLDPMARHPWSLRLEHAATAFLAAHGDHLPRPDVYVPKHGRYVTRADVVAFRGLPRYERPQPCRYGRTGNLPAVEHRDIVRQGQVTDTTEWQAVTVAEYLTTDLTFVHPTERRGWRGHRRITWSLAPRKARGDGATLKRKARKAQRDAAGVTGKRGRAATPWAMSERSLPRAVITAGATERAAILEDVLRTSADGATVTFGDVRVTIMGAAQVVDDQHGAYPVREWCRRAALAGVDPADL